MNNRPIPIPMPQYGYNPMPIQPMSMPPRLSSFTIYVSNFGPYMDSRKLRQMFTVFGTITNVKVTRNPLGCPCGFVAFFRSEDATRAIHEMCNTLYQGRSLYVARATLPAMPPSVRPRPPSSGYGIPPMRNSRSPVRYRGRPTRRPPMRPSSGYYPPPPM